VHCKIGSRTWDDGSGAVDWKSTKQTAGDNTMPNTSKIALVAGLIFGTASAALATNAFAANNYDSSDWAPMYAKPTVGSEPKVDARTKNNEMFVFGPSWQLSRKTDNPR
jgi:hypothetical protein